MLSRFWRLRRLHLLLLLNDGAQLRRLRRRDFRRAGKLMITLLQPFNLLCERGPFVRDLRQLGLGVLIVGLGRALSGLKRPPPELVRSHCELPSVSGAARARLRCSAIRPDHDTALWPYAARGSL